ncbi:MAG TPA: hypothetical protein DDY14_07370 [Chromatiaceae bacterium]|jgi:hypothetical protein|nr:MAG: hypothetical protein N838_19455 [Thiohalocapsa sp. PB-PSB1]QQO53522.1 MAG: hypothetical protein N838_09290 [Thiohalocapsa sp. PB-PSB1]HBG95133.1 hypothetical protein [Chromatiaceae bacterium]HCS88717.1 hypothetical protein [Chromatiaceae bacterium]
MITDQLLDQISTIISRAGLSTESIAALREAFPEQHFTYCSDDDIGEAIEPCREAEGFNIYLIDGSQHCVSFTRNQETATGLVLAEVGDAD